MNKINRALITAGLVVGSLSIGMGATPALATPLSTSSVSVSSGASAQAVAAAAVTDLRLPANMPEPSKENRRIPIGPVISFIKSVGVTIWNACVKAAKAGWSKMVGWWNSLAAWVQSTIKFIASASVSEIIGQIIDWVLHH